MPKSIRMLVLALVLLAFPLKTSAQSTIEAVLSAPETNSFPEITAHLEVRDGEGRFVSGLSPGDVVILENGAELAVQSLEEQTPGARIVLAVNPSPTFAVRDVQGLTRYDYVLAALDTWAAGMVPNSNDQLGLIVTGGPSEAALGSYRALRTALSATSADYRTATPNLSTLVDAITLAGDQTTSPGMGRAVLFITPEAEREMIPALNDMVVRARQFGVRIFVWMVTSEAFFETEGAVELRAMAEATGGDLFAYSGTETLPDPETYFSALRSIYELRYLSEVKGSGEFPLAARVRTPGGAAVSPETTLNLTVLPPNPIFVTPPDEIYRSLVPDTEGNLSAERRTPTSQEIEILIEFPDGYVRDLVRTTLYVNGQIAAENTDPPFDRFVWEIGEIQENGRFTLQVEAVDALGLSSISLETPVSVTVQRLPDGFVPAISRNSPVIVTVVVLLAGALLIGVLLRVRRLRPDPQPGNGNGKRPRRTLPDPVYQPVEIDAASAPAPPRLARWTNRLHWPQRTAPRSEPLAFLERIHDFGVFQAMPPTPNLAMHTSEVTLGKDPNQATFVLDDPSVAGLHARLHRNDNREFFISDIESISGTYINYKPTNGAPTRIEHGDLLHVGTVGFRFRVNPPPQTPLPSVEPKLAEPEETAL